MLRAPCRKARHVNIEQIAAEIRALGNAVVAAFFAHDKPRAREAARRALAGLTDGGSDSMWQAVRLQAATLARGVHPIRPLHWSVEFPEVFARDAPGFDAIVGNPPFAGKNTLINGNPAFYLDWLQTLHEGAHGNADLVAHFFRRAFGLLRPGGCFGLIATNTIGQGDTRDTGLRSVIGAGGAIQRAVRRLPWPGEAAVMVSAVHVCKGHVGAAVLDGRPVRRISAYLVDGDLDASPAPLAANSGRAFVGCYLFGLGFTFDDAAAARGSASSEAAMKQLIAKNPCNAERIFPYLGGEDVNTDPRHLHRRWCIDFADFPLQRKPLMKTWAAMDEREQAKCRSSGVVPEDYPDPVAADWPDLLALVDRLVKPERATNKRDVYRQQWWLFGEKRPALRRAIEKADRIIGIAQTSPHTSFAWIASGPVFGHTMIVIAVQDDAWFSVLQSRIHEIWARMFSSTFEDRVKYSPADAFRTFPFPTFTPHLSYNAAVGEMYSKHRSELMIIRGEGLTKTYNRFHDATENTPNILRLRELHHDMDVAVLRAYGWDDLGDRAAPEFLTEVAEPDHRYQDRLFWPASFRDEVLARLLDLNATRAAEEKRLGLAPLHGTGQENDEDEAA